MPGVIDIIHNLQYNANTDVIAALNAEFAKEIKQISELQAKVAAYEKQLDALGAGEIQNRKIISGLIDQNKAKTDALTISMGKQFAANEKLSKSFVDNTGRMQKATGNLTFATAQLLREAPAFTYSIQTGILALSNNIPILLDQLKGASESGLKTSQIFGALGRAIFSLTGLVTIAVAVFTIFGPSIANALSLGKDAAGRFNDEFEKTIKKTAEEVSKIELLTAALRSESSTREEILESIKQLKNNYPKYLSDLTEENRLTQEITENINLQIAAINAKGIKTAAQDVYKESLESVLKAQKDFDDVSKGNLGAFRRFGLSYLELLSAGDAETNALIVSNRKLNEALAESNEAFDKAKNPIGFYIKELENSIASKKESLELVKQEAGDYAKYEGGTYGSRIKALNTIIPLMEERLRILRETQDVIATSPEFKLSQAEIAAIQLQAAQLILPKNSPLQKEAQAAAINAQTIVSINALRKRYVEEHKVREDDLKFNKSYQAELFLLEAQGRNKIQQLQEKDKKKSIAELINEAESRDAFLRELNEREREINRKYTAFFTADQAAGIQRSQEELRIREENYNAEQKRINSLQSLRINQIKQSYTKDAHDLDELKTERSKLLLQFEELQTSIPLISDPTLEERIKGGRTFKPVSINRTKRKDEHKERLNEIKELANAYNSLARTVAQVFSDITEAQIRALDGEISARERRVTEAEKLAERGNTEALRLEQERLNSAFKLRAEYAKRAQAINAGLALSNAIVAVAVTAAESGVASIATIPAVLAALAAGYAFVKTLTAETEAFAQGEIDIKGPGTTTSDSIPARLSRGESVMTADQTARYKPALLAMRDGSFARNYLPVTQSRTSGSEIYATKQDFKQVNDNLKTLIDVTGGNYAKQEVNITEDGIRVATERSQRKEKRKWS